MAVVRLCLRMACRSHVVALSPNDELMIAGGTNGGLMAWKLGNSPGSYTTKGQGQITALAAEKDFALVAIKDTDKSRLYRWKPFENKLEMIVELPAEIPDLAIRPDKSAAVAAGTDQQLHFISLQLSDGDFHANRTRSP